MTVESMIREDVIRQIFPAGLPLRPQGVGDVLRDLSSGKTVLLELNDEVVLTFPAATATGAQTAYCTRHSSGFLQVALTSETCDRLLITEAAPLNLSSLQPQRFRSVRQCVTVDAIGGTTGISAIDRARTARTLAHPDSTHLNLTRPGHVVVVKVVDGGTVPSLAGAALDLCEEATGVRAAVYAELVDPHDGRQMARCASGNEFARIHHLSIAHLQP